jgi:predicted RNase H-related nuclease YkuK (DUF458 family)
MFHSPTYGKIDIDKLKKIIKDFMASDKKSRYEIIVGTDSQKFDKDSFDFVSALIVHRVGFGGIYFWKREIIKKKMSLKERIYTEATFSLQTAETFIKFLKTNGISRYNIQIHVDIGHNGETRAMIAEVVGMIRGSGYQIKIKPESYAASKVADRYT